MGASVSAASRPEVDFARGDKSFRHAEEDRSTRRRCISIQEYSSDSISSREDSRSPERRGDRHTAFDRPSRRVGSRSRYVRGARSHEDGAIFCGDDDGGMNPESIPDTARTSWTGRRRGSSGGFLRSRARRSEVVEGISSSSSDGEPPPREAGKAATDAVRRGRRRPVIEISSDSSSDERETDAVRSHDPLSHPLGSLQKSRGAGSNTARTPYSTKLTNTKSQYRNNNNSGRPSSHNGGDTTNVTHARRNNQMHLSSSSSDDDDIGGHGDEEEVYDWLEFDTRSSGAKSTNQSQKTIPHEGDETDEDESSDEVYDWLEFDTGRSVAKVPNQKLVSGSHQRPPNISLSPSLQSGHPDPRATQPFERRMLSPTERKLSTIPRTPDGNITDATASKTIFTPPTPDSPLVGAERPTLCRKPSNRIIKDTKRVTRKKAALPPTKPHAIKGDWLTNRYVVNNYILLNQLGKGSYGEVRLCKEKTSNQLFAIKVMDKKVLQKKVIGKSSTSFDDVKREVAIMKKLRHENVVRLYEVMDDPRHNKLYLVLEYMKRGDLLQIASDPLTKSTNPLTDEQVWDICRQVLKGLKYLHDNDICHGDIKPQNILVSDGLVKIADFGIAKMISRASELQLDTAGTPAFMAPEICAGLAYDGKMADMYAVGATMFCVRCGQPPFRSNPFASPSNQLLDLYYRIQNDPVVFPVPVADGLMSVIENLMVKDPGSRSTLLMVMKDPWLQVRPETQI